MSLRFLRYILYVVLVGVTVIRALPASGQTSQPAVAADRSSLPERLIAVLKSNEASAKAAVNISFEFKKTSIDWQTGGKNESSGTATLLNGGLEFARSVHTQSQGTQEERSEAIAFIGPRSAVQWTKGQEHAVQYFYPSLDQISDRAKSVSQAYMAPHPEFYGWGNGWISLANSIDNGLLRPDFYLWSIREMVKEGTKLLCIELTFTKLKPDRHRPLYQFVLDPMKGFIVVHYESRVFSDQITHAIDVTPGDINGAGLWYPIHIEHRYFDSAGPMEAAERPKVGVTTELTISNIALNPPATDAQFSVDAMNLPIGTRLIRYLEDGSQDVLERRESGFEVSEKGRRPSQPQVKLVSVGTGQRDFRFGGMMLMLALVIAVGGFIVIFRRPASK